MFSILVLLAVICTVYALDRREELIRHSPERYFAFFQDITAMEDMDVNISVYFKEDGKKQVCVFDKTDKITYCYELSNNHDKIKIDRSYRRSDLR